MDPKTLLIKSAETIESQTQRIAELEAALVTAGDEKLRLAQHIEQTKTASEATTKEASEAIEARKAELAAKAKVAAEKLFQSGAIANEQNRDAFAARMLDHGTALEALAKVAEKVSTAPKVATAVPRISSDEVETSESIWQKHVASAQTSLGSR
jgi:ABC-type phosphate transport system auxiliary subunit